MFWISFYDAVWLLRNSLNLLDPVFYDVGRDWSCVWAGSEHPVPLRQDAFRYSTQCPMSEALSRDPSSVRALLTAPRSSSGVHRHVVTSSPPSTWGPFPDLQGCLSGFWLPWFSWPPGWELAGCHRVPSPGPGLRGARAVILTWVVSLLPGALCCQWCAVSREPLSYFFRFPITAVIVCRGKFVSFNSIWPVIRSPSKCSRRYICALGTGSHQWIRRTLSSPSGSRGSSRPDRRGVGPSTAAKRSHSCGWALPPCQVQVLGS